MTANNLITKAKEYGFAVVTQLNPDTIVLLEDVRKMCSANTCGMYGKNWSCPPACGDLDTCREKIRGCIGGVLVQSVGDIEDSWDFESMMEIEMRHKERFAELIRNLQKERPEMSDMKAVEILPLGTGACTICKECSYPNAFCRFPEKRISSLEAYGILVSDLCKRNGVQYYYGSQKMAYTSCVFVINAE